MPELLLHMPEDKFNTRSRSSEPCSGALLPHGLQMTDPAEIYASLPYAVEVVPQLATDRTTVFVAAHPELRGCMSHGDTAEEALSNLAEARRLFIRALLEDGLTPPVPEATSTGGQPFSAIWTTLVFNPHPVPVVPPPPAYVFQTAAGESMELETLTSS